MNKIIQSIMDMAVGMAVFFGVKAFFPDLSIDALVMIALACTAVFAESIELRWKSGKKKKVKEEKAENQ